MDQEEARILSTMRAMRRRAAPAAALHCLVLSLLSPATAGPHTEPLIHMGVVCLREEPLASSFATRLAAEGKPMFYISDVTRGISQGDMIRFRNKAVLIDGDVWQTMMSMGVLGRLANIPVMTLKAQARSEVWDARSNQVSNSNENKGYTLGRELLKIFEDYFGKTPSAMELVVRFEGAYLHLVAPTQLMAELEFTKIRRMKKSDLKPMFVTTAPSGGVFASHAFSWTLWAVDPTEPSGQLAYSCSSEMPPGLSWSEKEHAIAGTPTRAGSWPLSVAARNADGRAATLPCTLTVVENTAPRVQARIDDPVVAGARWEYSPFVADAEHALNELRLRLFGQPPGMRIEGAVPSIVWNVPATLGDTSLSFVLAARDPLGATGKTRVVCHVVPPGLAHRTVTIDFLLPQDTLVQGHTYSWPDHVWMQAAWHEHRVRLLSIRGDDTTGYRPGEESEEGRLTVKPMARGTHGLVFTFQVDTGSIEVRKEMTVLPNRAPVFRSSLSSSAFDRNQIAQYKPVAVDEDGDSLVLTVTAADGSRSTALDGSVALPTAEPGPHTLTVAARDPFGNSARQQIYYLVRQPAIASMAWYVQKTYRTSVDIGFESKGFRIGLCSANIRKTMTTGFLGVNTYETPFLYFGGNPLGDRQAAVGNYLFIDGGVSFRMYDNRLYGGGMMARLQGNYRHNGTSPWRFQAFFATHLKQALLVADTSGLGWQLEYYTSVPEDTTFDPHLNYYVDKLSQVFDAYGPDNWALYFRLQTLYRLPAGFWIGPAAWLEEDIRATGSPDTSTLDSAGTTGAPENPGRFLAQYIGLCLLHEWQFGWLEYEQTLHLGWPGNSLVPKAQWNFTVKARHVIKQRGPRGELERGSHGG
jgi:hypothetical protein